MILNAGKPFWQGEQLTDLTVAGGGGGNSGAGWGALANVKVDFAALGDGVTDDTDQIQAAFDAVLSGLFAGVYFPPGIYRVDTLYCAALQGLTIMGAGAPIDTNTTLNRGTILKARAGNAGAPLLNLDGTAGFTIANLTIWGNTSASIVGASNGIRLQNVPSSGLGSGVAKLDQVVFLWCAVGFDAGSIDGGSDGVHDTNNAGDVSFVRCLWSHCTESFQSNQDQNVNFDFYGCQAFNTDIAVHVKKGGNVNAVNFATYDAVRVLKVDHGGANVYHRFSGLFVDGIAQRTKIFDGPAEDCRATFEDVNINVGQLAVAGGTARFTVGALNSVRLCRGVNLCNATGPLFEMSGGNMLVENCALPSNSANVVGTVSGGQYRVINCYNEATWNFLASYGDL